MILSLDSGLQCWLMRLETYLIGNKLVLCLRYVTEKYEIDEDVIGLYQLITQQPVQCILL